MLTIFKTLADWLTYDILVLNSETKFANAVHFYIEDVTKIFFLISITMFTVSFFRSKLQAEKLRRYLNNKPKWIAYVLAVMLGAITPFCSCSSIPLFIGFIEAGIPFGVVMAFLITSPMINEVAVPILAASFGLELTITYVITGMSVGIAGGLLMEKLGLEKYVEDYVYKIRMGDNKLEEQSLTLKEQIYFALNYTKETISKIWLYILLGIGAGAYIHGYVPQELFLQYASADNLLAVPFAVILGIPLYTDAVGIIPVASVLIEKSVPVGTVIAMMMSVVAISLPEMIILRKVLKTRLIAYYAMMLFVIFIMVGYAYNLIF
jgi:uncharacterized membrane protein YraQ (UPF0718 family)